MRHPPNLNEPPLVAIGGGKLNIPIQIVRARVDYFGAPEDWWMCDELAEFDSVEPPKLIRIRFFDRIPQEIREAYLRTHVWLRWYRLEDEGITWCRGWRTPDAEALHAVRGLA